MPLPTKTIQIMNIKKDGYPKHPYDFYVDRRTPLGNPFFLESEKSRDTVCDLYEEYFYNRLKEDKNNSFHSFLQMLSEAFKKYEMLRLFCNCHPKRCHSLTVKKYLEARINE